jgi:hypothetical protein
MTFRRKISPLRSEPKGKSNNKVDDSIRSSEKPDSLRNLQR